MFRPEQIVERLKRQPFEPVRFVVSEGRYYDIYHPDLVFVSERYVIIGVPSKHNPSVASSGTHVAMMHVVAMEDLPAVKTTNGHA